MTEPSDPRVTPDLEGIRTLVTGATSGLGFAMSRALAEAGARVLSHIMAADLAGSGIDVNLLLPGGATRSGMTPDSAPEDVQAAWLDPTIMGPPIVWLASRASDGITDQRIVATEFAAR